MTLMVIESGTLGFRLNVLDFTWGIGPATTKTWIERFTTMLHSLVTSNSVYEMGMFLIGEKAN